MALRLARQQRVASALTLALTCLTACGTPPIIDRGEHVSIGSDDKDAVCDGAALALDRLVEYQAGLLGESANGFDATVFLVSGSELESRCGESDVNGCVKDKGAEIWVAESVAVPHYLAAALVRQKLGSIKHDFLRAGLAEAISGGATYLPRFSSDQDVPDNLGNLNSRPGMVPMAGNYLAKIMREDSAGFMAFANDAVGVDNSDVESKFNEIYGMDMREGLLAWLGTGVAGCSVGVSQCSGVVRPLAELSMLDPDTLVCENGEVFDMGMPLGWTVVDLPPNQNCSLRADTDVSMFWCGGECLERKLDWSIVTGTGQWNQIQGIPGGGRVALEMGEGGGGSVALTCN